MSHKIFRLATSLILALAVLGSGLNTQVARAAGLWYVTTTGNDSNTCLSPGTACATINGALAKPGFVPGDTIRVAIGTYTGSGDEVVLLNQDTTLSGGWNATFTTQSGMSTIDGQAVRRGIVVNGGVTVMIERFVVENGMNGFNSPIGEGGGIFNSGTLTLNNSTIRNNVLTGNTSRGGGIYNESNSALTLNDSILSGNRAGEGQGGGIYNSSTGNVTLNRSTVSGNLADRDGGGILNSGGIIIFNNSTVSGNTTGFFGGGIFSTGSLTFNNSTVSGNAVTFPGGSSGGGIRNAGDLTLNKSTISGNTSAWNSGGIYNSGMATINQSAISNNSAIIAGGVWNDGGFGGSVGILNLNNTTISKNMSMANGGGIVNSSSGAANISNSTISGNNALGDGGGIFNGAAMNIQNTIVAKNTAAGMGPDCNGSMTSLGYNLIENNSNCNFAPNSGDLTGVDPLLGPLQDNGGSTFTHALLSGSPAIDAGNPAGCTDHDGNLLTTDQRGIARPQGPRCDIGAFELEADGGGGDEVTIDIKPGRFPNRIKLTSNVCNDDDNVYVAILTTPTFNARTVDVSTLQLGDPNLSGKATPYRSRVTDVDRDGDKDMLLTFSLCSLVTNGALNASSTELVLTGMTLQGNSFTGRDSVKIVR